MEEFDIIVENEEPLDVSPEIKDDFIRGEKGEKGDANKLTIGTVTKGENASATITGESPNQILNLVLPKGDTGEKGQDGDTPIKGEDYFTEAEIQQIKQDILADISSFDLQVVETLPTENIQEKTIYLVPNVEAKENNVYDEYIYVNSIWEIIGSTAVDLTDYYNKTEVDKKIDNIQGNEIYVGSVEEAPESAKLIIDGDEEESEEQKDIYSTSEVKTNKLWFGKPVYRKMFIIDRTINSGLNQNEWQHGIENVDFIYINYGMSFDTGGYINSLSSTLQLEPEYNYCTFEFTVNQSSIRERAYTHDSALVHKSYVCLEYTKTTD